eukprot:1599965-Amphidinium_carterae.1
MSDSQVSVCREVDDLRFDLTGIRAELEEETILTSRVAHATEAPFAYKSHLKELRRRQNAEAAKLAADAQDRQLQFRLEKL